MTINFRDINQENWQECADLSLTKIQDKFIAPNTYSLVQAGFNKSRIVKAIYNDDVMIGFIMYSLDENDNSSTIHRFMVDKRFQGNGYGKAALRHTIDLLEGTLDCKEIWISEAPENCVAKKLYASLGFEFTGEIEYDEEVMVKKNVSYN